jgi:hypothetical protein
MVVAYASRFWQAVIEWLMRIPVDRDRSFRIDVTEDSEFA